MLKSERYGRYELAFDKEIETRSRRTGNVLKKKSLYFVAIIVQKSYVGLYFMPIYSHRSEFDFISEDLLKTLKGKTCFHIKKWDKTIESEIKRMLNTGYNLYKEARSFR